MRDLVRFGVLTDDQIARRYGGAILLDFHFPLLVAGGLVRPWDRVFKDADVYSPTAAGTKFAKCGLKQPHTNLVHLCHDIAVVDLADYLLDQYPTAEFRTERELGRVLGRRARPSYDLGPPDSAGHRPDGLLLKDGKCLAIELEHTIKPEERYAGICRWFATELRVDGVRWFVDDPKIAARIEKVNKGHGFDKDVDVTIDLFPPGVVVRSLVHS